jgi:hypothetical protein
VYHAAESHVCEGVNPLVFISIRTMSSVSRLEIKWIDYIHSGARSMNIWKTR